MEAGKKRGNKSNTMSFKNHFSKQAGLYVKYRPMYPDALYAYLATLVPAHNLAWDCGTGNGQAAIALTPFFDTIVATDPSAEQIQHCFPHEKISYRVEKAETSSLAEASADLITIANALHWVNSDAFYAEVRRVGKPGGILAAWAYALPQVSASADPLIRELHDEILGTYWLPENQLVANAYRDVPFPFEQISSPAFYCEKEFTLNDMVGYFNTWSATQRYIDANGINPVERWKHKLEHIWGDPEKAHRIVWKLILKVGRL